jgi:signal transduction histidine kinase/CheY-like chemotaxis protein
MPLSPTLPRSLSSKQFVPFAILLVVYFLTVFAGSYLYTYGHTFPGVIWPATGIAIAGLYLAGRNHWPAIALGSLLADLAFGTPLFTAVLLMAARTGQILIGAWLLHVLNFSPLVNRLRDAFVIAAVAVVPTIIVPTVATIIRIYVNHASTLADFGHVWGPYWMGHIVSVIVLTPLIVRWITRPFFTRTKTEFLEIAAALAAVAAIDVIIFWFGISLLAGIPLVYVLLAPLFWIGLRLGPRIMTAALALGATIEILAVIYAGHTPSIGTGLFQAEQFIIVLSFIFLVLVTAVEERKEAIQLLRRELDKLGTAVKRIRREDEAKNEFIAILAHELRNPLAPIVSSLELIEYEELSESARHWVRIIADHTRTVRRLLDDLLDISRISQRKFRLRKEVVDLRDLVAHSLETSEPLFRSKRHRISFEGCEDPLMIEADPVRIEQVLVNLLNNAARYTEATGTITIACSKENGGAEVCIKDTGIGIAPHLLSRIFEPFVQVGTEKQGFAGLGIGLSLTKQLVDMHGGSIFAKSQGLGHGSEFIIRLPLARKIDTAKPLQKVPTYFPMPQTYRVLIVDDNEAAAQGLGKLLDYRGHETRLIYQGLQVLPTTQDFAPDVIILDIGLPDIDGYEVARRLRNEVGTEAILIALTGYGQDEDRALAKEAGFDYHLTKPVGLRDIEAVLVNRESAKL